MADADPRAERYRAPRPARLRTGVVLWALSWVPYGIIFGLSGVFLTLAWAFEITLGIVGLWLAGSEFARPIRASGWRGAPGVAWRTLVRGDAT